MKTSEMIAMLEKNPKLTFKNKDDSARVNRLKNPSVSSFSLDFLLQDNDWELVPEPVPAWEAIKALCEGKKIEWHSTDESKKSYYHPSDLTHFQRVIALEDFINGTWYIEEG